MQKSLDAGVLRSIEFFDGFLLRVLQEEFVEGSNETGLYGYYEVRVRANLGGLLDYEGAIALFLMERFPAERRFLHIGIGAGTTTSLLAAMGRRITGIEGDTNRAKLAAIVRNAVVRTWPSVEHRYRLIAGLFPEAVVPEADLADQNPVIFFTNFGAVLTADAEDRILDALPGYSDVVLDLALMGRVRSTEEQRADLAGRIESRGFHEGISVPAPSNAFYFHFVRRN